MGVDAIISYTTKDGKPLDYLKSVLLDSGGPYGFESEYDGAGDLPHFVSYYGRYWDPGYPRGNWLEILAILKELWDAPNINKVFYFGDSDYEMPGEFTKEDAVYYTRKYLGL